MAPIVHQLAQVALSAHAWNGDHSMVAVSMANSTEVHMFEVSADRSLKKVQTLKEHDQVVCALDWAPTSNLLLSCSHDRNAYVWKPGAGGVWEPSLVILRLNRAALCGRWSPDEAKFAVGSGAKTVCVCYYSPENDWWVSKQIKKQHSSSVTDVAWHPSGALLATASTDGRCRVFNAVVKGVDPEGAAPAACGATKFGDCLLELAPETGWVHACRWSPSGGWLAFCTHQSRAYFAAVPPGVEPENDEGRWPAPAMSEVAVPGLPLKALAFLSEGGAVAGGWGCRPVVLGADGGGGWAVLEEVKGAAAGPAAGGGSQFSSAMSVFKDRERDGGGDEGGGDGAIHYNCILEVRPWGGTGSFSTLGMDGKLVLWEGLEVEGLMAKLGL